MGSERGKKGGCLVSCWLGEAVISVLSICTPVCPYILSFLFLSAATTHNENYIKYIRNSHQVYFSTMENKKFTSSALKTNEGFLH